jgi:hypothetical protein
MTPQITKDIITGIIPEVLLAIFEAGDLDASHCFGLTCKKMYEIGKKHRTIVEEKRVKEEGYGVLKPRPLPRFTFGIDEGELRPEWEPYEQLRGPFEKDSKLPTLLKDWIGPDYIFHPKYMKTFVRKELFVFAQLGFLLADATLAERALGRAMIRLRATVAAGGHVGNDLEEVIKCQEDAIKGKKKIQDMLIFSSSAEARSRLKEWDSEDLLK